MIRIGWFSPISKQSGISSYSRNILEAVAEAYPLDEVQVIVFHPPTEHDVEPMPYPCIELSDALLSSDFHSLFDLAVYHVGNNALNHALIYSALRRHPGIVVLHDYVYQHYLAGVAVRGNSVSASYAALVHEEAGPNAFDFIAESGVLKCDLGTVAYVPWEDEWATHLPFGKLFASLGCGAIVHSEYALDGLGSCNLPVLRLFMPRPTSEEVPEPIDLQGNRRIHLVCGGHIGSTKGLRHLVEAFLRNPDLGKSFHVTIAGYGSDQEFLKVLRKDLRDPAVSGVFELVVDPTTERFNDILASADLFYNLRFPNTEGASLSLVEQLAMGRPVIAYQTGCFAEVPEDICYFLSRIGDVDELAALLEGIADEPVSLIGRGQRAWDYIRPQTAALYAERFVDFIKHNADDFRGGIDLTTMRRKGAGIAMAEGATQAWLADLSDARRRLNELNDNRLFVPNDLLDYSPMQIGRFIALNLLNSRVPEKQLEQIGLLIKRFDALDAMSLIGKLLCLVERGVFGRALFRSEYFHLASPIVDPEVWTVLSLLRPQQGVPLALIAAGLQLDAAQIEWLIGRVERDGFAEALGELLRKEDDGRSQRSELLKIAQFLEANLSESVRKLAAVVPGADLISMQRMIAERNCELPVDDDDDDADEREADVLWMEGFHDPEAIGVWSKRPTARLLLVVPAGLGGRSVSGRIGLPASPDSPETITVEVCEMRSGRVMKTRLRFVPDGVSVQDWFVPIDGFSGTVAVTLHRREVTKPADLGISADQRTLGVLLGCLQLEAGPDRSDDGLDWVSDIEVEAVSLNDLLED